MSRVPEVCDVPRVVRVLAWSAREGKGVEGDPVRRIYYLGTLDGRLLCAIDTHHELGTVPMSYATMDVGQPDESPRGVEL